MLETIKEAGDVSEQVQGSLRDEIKGLIRGEPIVRPDADEPPPDRRGRSSVPTSGGRDNKPDEDGEPDLEPEPQSS